MTLIGLRVEMMGSDRGVRLEVVLSAAALAFILVCFSEFFLFGGKVSGPHSVDSEHFLYP